MSACLSEKNLQAFVAGSATAEQTTAWNEHLDACETCAQRVAQLQAEQTEAMQPRSAGPSDRRDVGPGTRLGDFEIVRRVGQGGMGIVYEARQVSLDRKVALKILPPGLGLTTSAVVRFHREAQAAAKLHHTNIVAVYAEGEDNGTCYYAMELIEGQGLDEFIRDRAGDTGEARDPDATVTAGPGPTPTPAPTGSSSNSRSGTAGSTTGRDYFDMIARWIADVADALDYAHNQGVIHRDIKPSNLMLGTDGRVKLMDFGLARMLEQPGMTISGEFLGTPRYMSPEQITAGRVKIDHRTDIYSLGATLYELLTLAPPFTGERRDQILAQILSKEPRRPRQIDRRIPADLETICLKAIDKDPDRRYPTAGQMAEDLRRYTNRFAIAAKRLGPLGRCARFVRRYKLPVAAAVALVVMGSVATVAIRTSRTARDAARVESEQRERAERQAEAERLFFAGQKLHAEGRYQDALTEVKACLDVDPTRPEARLLHARLLFERDRADEAVAELEAFVAEQPDSPDAGAAHYLLATIYQGSDAAKVQEHQQRAEQLLPDTADAYYLRAMTGRTLEETRQRLDQALFLDRSHYPSLKARTLAHYTRGDYAKMAADANVCIALRQQDASAWSLRAVALREMGQLDDALRHHDRAIALAPDEVESYTLRRETYHRMGKHEKALADARRCVELNADEPAYRFRVFIDLARLGLYEAARQEAAAIARSDPAARRRFESWLKKQVFNALADDEAFELPEGTTSSYALSAMREAAEYYRALRSKGARRVVAEGFRANFSPNGKQIVYGRGMPGSNRLEILDLETGETRLLAVPGKDPMWAPDGKYIAFVRERQARSTADPSAVSGPRQFDQDQEVWIISPDGKGLRRLASGHSVSWGRDSTRLYFYSLARMTLYRIHTDEATAEAVPVLSRPMSAPMVSPDEAYVAYTVGHLRLDIVELPSGSLVRSWSAPAFIRHVQWSPDPDRHELSAGGIAAAESGLWIFVVERDRAWKVFDGPVTRAFWSPDRDRLAFDIRWQDAPWEIWVLDLDPKVPTTQALGPAQTPEDHVREKLAKLTRAIEADRDNFDAYSQRADLYAYQEQWRAAIADYTPAIRTQAAGFISRYRLRAEAYLHLKKNQKAAADYEEYRKALEARGGGDWWFAWERNNLAWVYVTGPPEIRDPKKALELAQAALNVFPNNAEFVTTLGAAYYRLERFDKALTTLRRAAEVRPTGPDAATLFFLAMSHHQLDQPQRAQEAYEAAVKWWEPRKPLGEDLERELTALRAEADALMGKAGQP